METATREYLAITNEAPTPFVWTKTADEILDNVARLCQRISKRVHADVGCGVTLTDVEDATAVVGGHHEDEQQTTGIVGTPRKSTATSEPTWY